MNQCTHCAEELDPLEASPSQPDLHKECADRLLFGGVNHIIGRCTCCGGTHPPDPEHTPLRMSAMFASGLFRRLALEKEAAAGLVDRVEEVYAKAGPLAPL